MQKERMSDEQFQTLLKFGGKFEDAILPALCQIFVRFDPYALILPLSTSKTDKEHGRGQRFMYCADTSASYMAPDFVAYVNGKSYLIEAKAKSRFYKETGINYGIIDKYKVDDYNEVMERIGASGLFYVFGDKENNDAYIARGNVGVKTIIPYYSEWKNPKGEFYRWELSKSNYLGKWR